MAQGGEGAVGSKRSAPKAIRRGRVPSPDLMGHAPPPDLPHARTRGGGVRTPQSNIPAAILALRAKAKSFKRLTDSAAIPHDTPAGDSIASAWE